MSILKYMDDPGTPPPIDIIIALTLCVTWQVSFKKQKLLTHREQLDSPQLFGGVSDANFVSFLHCIFCFVCLRRASCVPNVVSVSGLFILDITFSFL
jgi:hypothetical protein